jgi:hypothetical protein
MNRREALGALAALPRLLNLPEEILERLRVRTVAWPASRAGVPGRGRILDDIERHLWPGHNYRSADLVNWVHEGVHGVSSRVRSCHGGWDRVGAVYLTLRDEAIVIREPRVPLSQVRTLVPASLLDQSTATTYFGNAAWSTHTLYLVDEFNAYTTGTWAGIENDLPRGDSCLYMLQLGVYALCGLWATVRANRLRRLDLCQFSGYLSWNWQCRALPLLRQSAGTAMDSREAAAYLAEIQKAADAEPLRAFIRQQFGAEWAARVLQI